MKKVLLLIASFSLILGLAGCDLLGGGEDPVDLTLTLNGVADEEIFVETAFNVFTGVTALGSDDVDYTADITADSVDCEIQPNGDIDTTVTKTCHIDYTVVVEGKVARASKVLTVKVEVNNDAPVVAEWDFSDAAQIDEFTKYEGNNTEFPFTVSLEDGAMKVELTAVGAPWEPRLDIQGLPMEEGEAYTVTFRAKASEAGKPLTLKFGELLPSDPWFTEYHASNVVLTTEWAEYTYSFVMPEDNLNAGPTFEMGDVDASGLVGTIWFDDIVVRGGSGEDTIAPTIDGADDITLFIEDNPTFDPLAGVTATDYPDTDLTSSIVLSGNTVDVTIASSYMILYTVMDEAGNKTTVSRNVVVKNDTEAPMLEGTDDIVVFVGQEFDLLGNVKATDNRDGDVTADIVVDEGDYDLAVEGVYTVTYTIEDAVGNESVVERRVEVSALEFNATDLIGNGGFDNGPWKSYHANWDGTTANSQGYIMDGQLVFEVTDLGSDFWHNLIEQPGINLVNGKSYRLSFDAKASVASALETELVARNVFNITTEMATYTLDITATEDAEKTFKFLIGTVAGAVPATFTFDNIKFEEIDGGNIVADTNQVVNGDFSGEFYNDGWNAHGGSFKVNDYSAIFNYGAAGGNPWDNKLEFGGVEMVPGRIYMLKFTARGDAARDFKVNFWDGSMGHESAKLQLTTDWKDFVVIFQYNSKNASTLEFQLGKLTENFEGSMFYVDNVVLEQAVLPEDLYLVGEELFENPMFELGAWKSYHANWNAAESNLDIVNEELVVEIVNLGEDFWHNLIEQPGMDLVNGTQYRISFKAKADAATALEVELLSRTVVNITTAWDTYTVDFTASADEEKVLKFLMGTVTGAVATTIYFDDIMLEEYDGSNVVANTNQVVNGDFTGEFQQDGWSLVVGGTASNIKVNDYVAIIEYDGSTTGADSVFVETTDMTLEDGKTYVISFDANVSADRDVVVQLTDGTFVVNETISMTAGWKNYEVEFKYDSANAGKLQILLGDGVADSKIELDNFVIGGYVLLDSLVLTETDIAETTFDEGYWNPFYATWTSAMAYYKLNAGAVEIEITDFGPDFWSVLLEQGNLDLVATKTYRVTFDAKATAARDIQVELAGLGDPVAVAITDTMATYTVDFTVGADNVNTFLKFLMGNTASPALGTVTLDNVKVEEYDGTNVVANTDVLMNGDFEAGFVTNGWSVWADDGKGTFNVEYNEGVIRYDSVGDASWKVKAELAGLVWEDGATYLVEFIAKGDAVRDFQLSLWDGGSGQTVGVGELGTEWNQYRMVFTYSIGTTSTLEVQLGKLTENFAGSMMYIDDITVTKVEMPAAE